MEREVIEELHKNQDISDNIDDLIDEKITFAQRIADRIADFGGSWTLIISFLYLLFLWIGLNLYLLTKPFGPYPYILLNLILSSVAALQIMMSQNRQEQKDWERSKHNYQVNLKAEFEIGMLHEKVDHLILNQQQRLFEIQQIQVEMLGDIAERLPGKP